MQEQLGALSNLQVLQLDWNEGLSDTGLQGFADFTLPAEENTSTLRRSRLLRVTLADSEVVFEVV